MHHKLAVLHITVDFEPKFLLKNVACLGQSLINTSMKIWQAEEKLLDVTNLYEVRVQQKHTEGNNRHTDVTLFACSMTTMNLNIRKNIEN